jgi:diaminohydroxyphosphoribosylaminopyrimidine deaminase/5-amino-6-(5-phosphoribosylamino)uracil reductase
MDKDTRHMRHALALASRGLGNVAPNPAVGCVIVSEGRIIGRGRTQPGGRPHAEAVALQQAGSAAKGATAYVSLEPCAHVGQTPSCANSLIEAGIACVVVAVEDPDTRTAGQGTDRLRKAGIEVTTGVCEAEATWANRGFLSSIQRKRPWVTLKLATSADGMIAWKSGTPQWITNELSRKRGHLMRARYDTLVTGSGTVLADDPSFTCRIPGLEGETPLRVVLDRRGQVELAGNLAATASAGPIQIRRDDESLEAMLNSLAAEEGITRVMVECGAALATAFLAAGLVDEVAWFRAPSVLGDDGVPGLVGISIEDALREGGFQPRQSLPLGEDVLETFVKEAY